MLTAIAVATFVSAWQSGRRDLRRLALWLGAERPGAGGPRRHHRAHRPEPVGGRLPPAVLDGDHQPGGALPAGGSTTPCPWPRTRPPRPASRARLDDVRRRPGWCSPSAPSSPAPARTPATPRRRATGSTRCRSPRRTPTRCSSSSGSRSVCCSRCGHPGPRGAVRAAVVLVVVELAQGLIGFVQYFTDLPIVLVELPPARRRPARRDADLGAARGARGRDPQDGLRHRSHGVEADVRHRLALSSPRDHRRPTEDDDMAKTSPLTPTSYALLGLLAVQPWTTYELAKQMDRTMNRFWPRAKSKLYEEPKKLVAHGLASARRRRRASGRGPSTRSRRPGRQALAEWLGRRAAEPVFESEHLLKVFFAENGTTDDLRATLAGLRDWVHEKSRAERRGGVELPRGRRAVPRAAPTLVLTGRFLDDYLEMLDRWAGWADEVVADWPDSPADASRTSTPWPRRSATRPEARAGRSATDRVEAAERRRRAPSDELPQRARPVPGHRPPPLRSSPPARRRGARRRRSRSGWPRTRGSPLSTIAAERPRRRYVDVADRPAGGRGQAPQPRRPAQ